MEEVFHTRLKWLLAALLLLVPPSSQQTVIERGLTDSVYDVGDTGSLQAILNQEVQEAGEWYKNGSVVQELTDKRQILRAPNSRQLVIYNVQYDDSGLYTFSINGFNTSATVAVRIIERGLTDSVYDVGDTGHLQVILNQEVQEAGEWYKNGSLVQELTNKPLILRAPKSRQLVIYNVQYDDSGLYTFSINGFNTSATVTVGVIDIVIRLRDVEAVVGEQMSFRTTLSQSAIRQGYWTKDGVPLFPSAKHGIFVVGDVQQLTITSLSTDDAGMYTYTIRGKTTSANLVIKGKPAIRILRRLESVSVIAGQSIPLSVTLSEPNVPVGTWYRNGVPVSESENRQISVNGNFHQLLISSAQAARDDGIYVYVTGQLVTSAIITVNAVRIISFLQPQTVREGSTTELQTILSIPDIDTGVWSKDGKEISGTQNIVISTVGRIQRLVINETGVDAAGEYSYTINGNVTRAQVNVVPAPVDGNVTAWTQWVNTSCSTSCGPGVSTRTRFRTCTNPAPAFGGSDCSQQLVAVETISCNEGNCPVDGNVTAWTQWVNSSCSRSCGPGVSTRTRFRTCTNPAPAFNGSDCSQQLIAVETINCTEGDCPVDGGVAEWSQWSGPSCDCGAATTRQLNRFRTCTNPTPANGGRFCNETLTETITRNCNLSNCPVDGGVGEWSNWADGECSQTCGEDVFRPRTRSRTCTSPPPSNGGLDCQDILTERMNISCNLSSCPIDGNVTAWTQWVNSSCSRSCGPGVSTRTRFRTCTNPAPAFNGSDCSQQLIAVETINCTEGDCPVDGGVAEWSQWSGPSCDCGAATTRQLNRFRTCTNPTPANGGRFCNETLTETITRNCNLSNCPVDGGVGEWSNWADGECSQTCGEDVFRPRTRSRTCTSPPPSNGGLDCQDILTERMNISCNLSSCPIDGNVTAWTQWVNSSCSRSCGPGVSTRTRFRTCTNPAPAFNGSDCSQQLIAVETMNCTEGDCPVDGGVAEWSQWSGPSCDCGAATTRQLNRFRTCTNPTPANGGRFCNETLTETITRNCNLSNCPVDGGVGEWSNWADGECSQTCGEDVFRPRTRSRTCTSPPPSNGGLDCQDILTERMNISCNLSSCPIDGNVTAWTQWVNSSCSRSCGPGVSTRTRFRTCTNPAPAFNGSDCSQQLIAVETINCTEGDCPVDGGVAQWSQWSGPSCDCGAATTRQLNRFRTCTNPTPANGGRFCNETLTETITRNCNLSNCPVDGGVGEWSNWADGECSQTCGEDVFRPRTRSRTCTSPPPSNGGLDCQDILTERMNISCNLSSCPIDGNVTAWTQWVNSSCSRSCGPGVSTRTRFRTCTNPAPAFNGSDCSQQLIAVETINCTEGDCPVDGGVAEWSQWSGPSCDCGAATTRQLNRFRTCTNPTPANGGRFCNETLTETITRNCNLSNCPVDGGVGEWSNWADGECSQTCGEDVFRPRTRSRTCTSPPPSNGGLDCQDILTERMNISCNLSSCPIDGNVTAWTQWVNSSCSRSCGPGVSTRTRFRTCTNPAPAFNGSDCSQQLIAVETINCTEGDCPVDGGVAEWSQWSGPSCDCGAATTRQLNRFRTCTNPTPANGGRFCNETLTETITRNCNLSNCPVDGGVGEWSNWADGECSQTCGEDVFRPRTRSRTCTSPRPSNGGLDCQDILTERINISCNLSSCPIDGNVTAWTQWVNSSCSRSCGPGVSTRTRFRTCTNPAPAFNGSDCSQQLIAVETINCTEGDCPVDGGVAEWSQWSGPSCDCGAATTRQLNRFRTCTNPTPANGGRFCNETLTETITRNCNLSNCPVDGGVGEWSNWADGECSQTCGEDVFRPRTRSRTCTSPRPSNGGLDCQDILTERMNISCNLSSCPIDGNVTAWTQWVNSSCSRSCGPGVSTRTRFRTCTNPAPAFNGSDCSQQLIAVETINCTEGNCPVDGNVTAWTQWVNSSCSRSCGPGVSTRTRFRTCTNPAPAFNGSDCSQQLIAVETINCTEGNCPVDGNVTAWTQWVNSSCSRSCGPGVSTRTRFRTCTNPAPAFNGSDCSQQLIAVETINCTEGNCPVDGNVTAWTQWVNSSCSRSCGPGVSTRTRFRTCTNPAPAFNGSDCSQQLIAVETINCTEGNCPVDGNVTAWTQWVNSSCSRSCGPGVSTRTRFRTCTNPAPAFNGSDCSQQLIAVETINCTEGNCPVDGNVTAWTQWVNSSCSRSCGPGVSTRTRFRTCTNPAPAFNGSDCSQQLIAVETINCTEGNCPVDGNVTAWTQWVNSSCSRSCGPGVSTRTRFRTCTNPAPAFNGSDCSQQLIAVETINCTEGNCPVDGNVTAWTQWVNSSCSRSCGPGVSTRTRFRTCTNPAPAFNGSDCSQQLIAVETINCTEGDCPVDGGVAEWSQWSGPSCDCGAATTRQLNRFRTCTNPTPANSGRFCNETLIETITRNCNLSNCPVDGGVGEWSNWADGECSQTCGEDVFRPRTRSRTCTSPRPSNGGLDCQDILTERMNISCNLSSCPIDGNVTAWTQWVNSSCSRSCGPGVSTRTRFRTCTNPAPAFNGSDCSQQLIAVETINCTEGNCPVDGNVTAWTQWVNSSCSRSCGPGVSTRTRFRTCTNPAPAFNGSDCSQQLIAVETINCTEGNCPVDGNVTAWTQWVNSSCSRSCGPGVSTRTRFRTCTNPAPAFNGSDCSQQLIAVETINCTEGNCPVDGGVAEWSQWSGPSCDCGAATTRQLNRFRTCTNPTPANGGRFCNETLTETITRNCNLSNCPVDGGVGEWSNWADGECSQTCGEDVFRPRTRSRTCTSPPPSNGGLDCQDILTERMNISCNLSSCPIDGNVTAWTQWVNSSCSRSCGQGVSTRTRFRTCTNPAPAFNGSDCSQQLIAVETINCTEGNCPVDGGVAEWSQWSGPSCDCGAATTRQLNRFRTCTNPTPANGGRFCNETLTETITRNCNLSNCPVDGGVGEWSNWADGECSQTCGEDVFRPRTRSRTCTSPPPSNGGLDCQDILTERMNISCNLSSCPIDGNVTAWTQWVNSSCSRSCGQGVSTRTRFRTCTNPAPAFNGSDCSQQLIAVETINCTEGNCPVDGGVAEWSQWSGPSCDCGAATTRQLNRFRTCTNPTPANGGRFCNETLTETITRNCNLSNCPVDGGVGEWSNWADGECSQTCGEDVFRPRTRSRTCTSPPPSNGGLDCQDILTERMNISCNLSSCPIDGNVTAWTQWVNSSCSRSCGQGVSTRTRFRTCTNPAPAFNGSDCSQQLIAVETINCTEGNCPVDGGVAEWSQWSGPSCDCGAATTRQLNRFRTCTNPTPANGGRFCNETLTETITRNCNLSNCPVDGGVGEWSNWADGECSQTCGEDVFRPRTRSRTCTSPPPSNGGLDCQDILTERMNISCNLSSCPIDGNVTAWTQWVNSSCSRSCGQGVSTRTRFRTCTNPAPAFNGSDCSQQLIAVETINCTEGNCPVDGGVAEWSQWSGPSCDCGAATTRQLNRFRTCTNPTPANGGRFCNETLTETITRNCNLSNCPVDGGVGEWSNWADGECSQTCGEDVFRPRTRSRTCTSPPPSNGGLDCQDILTERMNISCNLSSCPIDGNVTAWTQWVNSSCSRSCGQGVSTRTRFRTCTNPAPAFNGSDCSQQLIAVETINCTEGNCPVDGGVAEWSQWSGPSCDCGAATTRQLNRFRTCTNPTPANGGRFCNETLTETITRNCNLSNCPVDGGVGEWSNWADGECSQTCGEDVFRPRTRSRTCTSPPPSNGGLDCQDILTERMNISCNLSSCPIDGNVTAWTQWVNSSCSRSCGQGVSTRTRFRTCTNPAPAFNGSDCSQQLIAVETINCTEGNCPVDGGVAEWSQWSGPSCDCGAATTRQLNRFRTCTNPTPANGGRFCNETLTETITRNCNLSNCPVDGGVGEWSNWADGECSQTCGEDVFRPRTRSRTCTSPPPSNGGLDCQDILTERMNISCNLSSCPIDGNVTAWTQWVNSSCSRSCGQGVSTRTRFRTCTNPAPAFNGSDCSQQLIAVETINCTEGNCPVDGGVAEWSQWSGPSCDCGAATTRQLNRFRTCTNPTPANGGRFCNETLTETITRNCNLSNCPVDGGVGEWSNWADGECSQTCGEDVFRPRTRSRTCTSPPPSNGGLDCQDILTERMNISCNLSSCPIDGNVTAWTQWVNSSCSRSCGPGVSTRTRFRTCTNPAPALNGSDCSQQLIAVETINCTEGNCPVDGNVTAWTQWVNSSCSRSCGPGVSTRTRFRTCTNPAPALNGSDCSQQLIAVETINCTEGNCPVDGNVTAWTQWVNSPCSRSCGPGVSIKSRFRTCTNPAPAFGGMRCGQEFVSFETFSCTGRNCPVDGGLSDWGAWNTVACSATCGEGETTVASRTRTCSRPTPAFGGKDCTGTRIESESINCSLPSCPVECNFTDWSPWSSPPCNVTCGQTDVKIVTRVRSLITQPTGGANCVGPTTQNKTVTCGYSPCPVVGVCDDVVLRYGVGYRSHPTECDKYIQCYFYPNGSALGVYRSCSFGYSWNQATLSCVESRKVSCPMASQNCGPTYKMEGNCRSYRRYVQGKLESRCCAMGYSFSPTAGCRPNFYCDDVCPSPYFSRDVCDKYPDWDSPLFYNISVGGFGWTRASCPQNSSFDIVDCGCLIKSTDNCEARYMWAFGSATTPSWLTIRDVLTVDDVGVFNTSSYVFLNITMTTSNRPLALKFQFREIAEVNDSRVLVSCTDKLVISSTNDGIQFVITNKYGVISKLFIFTNGISRSDWKTVTAWYKDRTLTGTVESGSVKYISQVFAKDVDIMTDGINLGSDAFSDKRTAFIGDISTISVYECDQALPSESNSKTC